MRDERRARRAVEMVDGVAVEIDDPVEGERAHGAEGTGAAIAYDVTMHLLFVDESGKLDQGELFALGGIAVRDSSGPSCAGSGRRRSARTPGRSTRRSNGT